MTTPTRLSRHFIIAMLIVCGASAIVLASSEVQASTCTFSSSGMVYDNNFTGQTVKFSWNTSTGAVSYDSGTCNISNGDLWDDIQGGTNHYYCGESTSPGSVQTGTFNTSSDTPFSFTLNFFDGVGEIYNMIGYIAGESTHRPTNPVSFVAIVNGSTSGNSSILAGSGSVSCI